MHKTVVINAVGLTPKLLAHAPALSKFAQDEGVSRIIETIPAVTTTMQSTFLTGKTPRDHGIVGNGWYDRSDAEVK
ncbi:MAG TPA: alkaline phosphatase family protein, partial [Tepidisphaeraceae bacterium]|nr:alkaline phosphatase family protein [Tepidisphaeraceae bacterium]